MAYSIDFIKRAVAYRQAGHTFAQLREAFAIPSATYYDWEAKFDNGHFDITIKREWHRKTVTKYFFFFSKKGIKYLLFFNLFLNLFYII